MYSALALLLFLNLSTALSNPNIRPNFLQQPFLTHETNSTCDCSNTNSSGPPTYPPSICNDYRLGPIGLPRTLPLLSFISDYDRFGGDTPGNFLAKWTDAKTGRWIWPEAAGYSLDIEGNPIVGKMILEVGTQVDRFGSENGTYVSAADAPFDQRSLPPSSLSTPVDGLYPYGYHIYTVVKPLVAEGGLIAPWFGQPGLGSQFNLKAMGTVWQLTEELGYLKRIHKGDVDPGAGSGGGCGL